MNTRVLKQVIHYISSGYISSDSPDLIDIIVQNIQNQFRPKDLVILSMIQKQFYEIQDIMVFKFEHHLSKTSTDICLLKDVIHLYADRICGHDFCGVHFLSDTLHHVQSIFTQAESALQNSALFLEEILQMKTIDEIVRMTCDIKYTQCRILKDRVLIKFIALSNLKAGYGRNDDETQLHFLRTLKEC